jgi:hypothetical protein
MALGSTTAAAKPAMRSKRKGPVESVMLAP